MEPQGRRSLVALDKCETALRDETMKPAFGQMVKEIHDDNRSGASEIARKVAASIIVFSDSFEGNAVADFKRAIQRLGLEIVQAQPAMATLFNLVNGVLLAVEEEEGLIASQRAVKKRARAFVAAMESGWQSMTEATSQILGEGSTILVHSDSGTLCRVLLALHEQGRTFSVICTESRPMLEGVTLARRLAGNRVSVRLIADTAAFQLLPKIDLILVGADTVTPSNVINKIGTRGLAVAAEWEAVPLYVLAGTEKCLRTGKAVEVEKERRPPEEIFQGNESIEVLNFYFDQTPLELLSGVITEKGLWNPKELGAYVQGLRLHPALVEWQGRDDD
jgi:translation initiation factor 2B subunit (eIF-2B alpha/beta/delta family)